MAATIATGRSAITELVEPALTSAIISESTNALINPAHPACAEVQLHVEPDFTFDARPFKR
jgi:hypothetical protein